MNFIYSDLPTKVSIKEKSLRRVSVMIKRLLIHPEELSKKWIDRMVREGVDVLGIHPVGGVKAADSLTDLLEMMKTPKYQELIDYAIDNKLEIEYEFHGAGYLMPKSLFEEHPEYFRMNLKGERVNDSNFCVSIEEALDLFAKRAAELALSLYGSNHNYYFWMDDGRDLYCHCPKCRNLSASDQQLIAVNAMQREIRKYIPDAKVAYLAYVDTIVPPKQIKPEEGVFLEYAPFEKYTANGENAQQLIEQEWNMIDPLLSFFGKEDAKVLEYWYDNSMYSLWKKPPKEFVLKETEMLQDIKSYRKIGFKSAATFACFLGEDYEKLYGEVDIRPFAELCN